MRSSDIFQEYVWLLTTIRDAGGISFSDISSRWQMATINDSKEPMARTTFNRHRQAIERIFDVEIKCNRTDGNKYYIDNSAQLESREITEWLSNSLVTGTMLSDFKSLNNRISLEPVPTANATLRLILEAMTQNSMLEIQYFRIGDEDPKSVNVEPFAVKLFKQRWYLLGHVPGKDGLRLFSLERIIKIVITDCKFSMPEDFSAREYFSEIYGVMSAPGDVEVQRVVLRAFGRDRLYLEDLPMHPSQHVIEVSEIYTDFELRLRPTADFASAILSRGGWVKVIEPQWFADELLHRADFMIGSFEENVP